MKKSISILAIIASMMTEATAQSNYAEEISIWDSTRVRDLKAGNGWLNLAGLYWLQPGENRIGTDAQNEIVFPTGSVPGFAGTIKLQDGVVTWQPARGVKILVGGVRRDVDTLFHPRHGFIPVSAYGSYRWTIIKREDRYAIRLRDLQHPLVINFPGISRFPVDTTWRVKAYLQTTLGSKINITNVLGQTTAQESPGKLVFQLKGKTYTLDALKEGNELFIVFGDETSGISTYPSGRFIYTQMPDAQGYTILDFNKAFNPPCAFSEFATCPLPPRQNVLPLAVEAGEKNFEKH